MATQGEESAFLSKLSKSRKTQFTECVQGLVRLKSGGHEGSSCNAHHDSGFDHTRHGLSRVADAARTSCKRISANPTDRPGLFTRFKRSITQAVFKAKARPQSGLRQERSFLHQSFKTAEGAFPFRDAESLFPPTVTRQMPLYPVYDPYANSPRSLSMVLETVEQTSQRVPRSQPLSASVQETGDYMNDHQMETRMREEIAEYEARESRFGGITRNRKGTNRKRQPPRRFGPYWKPEGGVSNDPFIGPLQRSMSNAKKDLKRTLSKPPFMPPFAKPFAEASTSSDFLAQFWDCDSDVEVRSSHSTVEQTIGSCGPGLEE